MNHRFAHSYEYWGFLLLLGVWTASQPLAVILSLPQEITALLLYSKNILGAATVIYGLVVMILKSIRSGYLSIDGGSFVISMLFLAYIILVGILRPKTTSYEEYVLYFLWFVAAYLVFPMVILDEETRSKALLVILIGDLAVLIPAMILGFNSERVDLWRVYSYRATFNFASPVIFAESWQIVIPIAMYFLYSARSWARRMILWGLILSGVLFVYLARSETTLAFVVCVLLAYFFAIAKVDYRLLAAAACLVVIGVFLFVLISNIEISHRTLESLVSGRISYWTETIRLNFLDQPLYLITGRSDIAGAYLPYMRFRAERIGFPAARAQVDNTYLGLLLQGGIIGLVMFMTPLLRVFGRAIRSANEDTSRERYNSAIIAGSWLGIFLQMFGAAVIPSFGNVINIFLLAFMMTSYPLSKKSSEGSIGEDTHYH